MSGQALHRRIIEDPEDLTARLIYCDWLEEQGKQTDLERAEFIRLSIQLESIPAFDDRREVFDKRLKELMNKCWGDWVVSTQRENDWARFIYPHPRLWFNGFFERVSIANLDYWEEYGPDIVSNYPIRWVEIEDKQPFINPIRIRIQTCRWLFSDEVFSPSHADRYTLPADYRPFIPANEFDSVSSAKVALSKACISIARALAHIDEPIKVNR